MAGKLRSPNYPALSLPQAIDVVGKLWSEAKRSAVSHDAAAQAMGFKSLSGPARVAIGTLRQYGLIEKAEKGHIRISDLAVKILHGADDEEHAQALQEAALTPDLFMELAKSHIEASENVIRSYLITKKAFAEDGARKAARAFKETMELAKVEGRGYTAPNAQEKPQAMAGELPNYTFEKQGPSGTPESGLLSLTVPYGGHGQLTVQVRVAGERLKRSHVEKVLRYLELAKDDLGDGD